MWGARSGNGCAWRWGSRSSRQHLSFFAFDLGHTQTHCTHRRRSPPHTRAQHGFPGHGRTGVRGQAARGWGRRRRRRPCPHGPAAHDGAGVCTWRCADGHAETGAPRGGVDVATCARRAACGVRWWLTLPCLRAPGVACVLGSQFVEATGNKDFVTARRLAEESALRVCVCVCVSVFCVPVSVCCAREAAMTAWLRRCVAACLHMCLCLCLCICLPVHADRVRQSAGGIGWQRLTIMLVACRLSHPRPV